MAVLMFLFYLKMQKFNFRFITLFSILKFYLIYTLRLIKKRNIFWYRRKNYDFFFPLNEIASLILKIVRNALDKSFSHNCEIIFTRCPFGPTMSLEIRSVGQITLTIDVIVPSSITERCSISTLNLYGTSCGSSSINFALTVLSIINFGF